MNMLRHFYSILSNQSLRKQNMQKWWYAPVPVKKRTVAEKALKKLRSSIL